MSPSLLQMRGEHPDGRRKEVRQMIEHANSHVVGWSKLKPSLFHLTEFMNPSLWQMTEPSRHVNWHNTRVKWGAKILLSD